MAFNSDEPKVVCRDFERGSKKLNNGHWLLQLTM